MIVKTKKYELSKKKYIGIATKLLIKREWKYFGIPVALLILGIVIPGNVFWWFFAFALLVPGLYLLFWWIQFAGFTQHEAGKMFFYKLSYEIDSRQFMLKVDTKHGMPVDWKNFKKCVMGKDAFILTLSKAQFIYLPFDIFRSEADVKLAETIFKRKNLL